jgi:hypothetical protein
MVSVSKGRLATATGNRQAHHRGALHFPQLLGEGLPWLLLDHCFVTDGSMLLPLTVSSRLAPSDKAAEDCVCG